jgi:uncharacterized protein (TIGR03435 family)
MKKLLLIILLSISIQFAKAQLKIGDTVSNIAFKTLLNAPISQTDLGHLKGKVIWLEFWATWCSPCLAAMPDLQQLQKEYNSKLQVITITSEKETRIKQFIQNRPSNLWFAIDTADALRAFFPFRTIPQSVLIDKKGVVVAITAPENITRQTIADVIAGKMISLPLKADNMVDDPWTTYFPADSTIQSRFLVQPAIIGQNSSGYKTYPHESGFKNRRVTMMNLPLENAYRVAYGDMAYSRIIDLTPRAIEESKKMYCMDLIVPKGQEAELMPDLIKQLQSNFDLQAAMEKRRKAVYVLTIADPAKISQLKKTSFAEENFSAGQGEFNGQDVSLNKIADYLEGFGVVKMPVVDETGNTTKYDINFTYLPEKQGDLENALAGLGLKLTKAERDIDILVFR